MPDVGNCFLGLKTIRSFSLKAERLVTLHALGRYMYRKEMDFNIEVNST